ncbi:MAG: SEC-C metal-binding domain-containing protein, partial [Candidatus Aminicenantes bacterium]|nr:SEC-C metal-binding domain-containing protein [Candidatus Aminicenantes bacterium]
MRRRKELLEPPPLESPPDPGYPQREMSRKVGRNEPCPCGSGKKYKKCCGLNAPHEHLIPPEHRTGTPLDDYMELLPIICAYGQKILRFEEDGPELKRAISRFEKRYRPGKKGGLTDSFYMSWLNFDFRFGPTGETIAERVLRDPLLATLSEPGPTLIRRMAESYLSFYEVVDPGPEAVIVEELGTGKRFRVICVRELFEFEPEQGEVWYTRLVGPPEEALSYTTPYVYAPLTRAEFKRLVQLMAEDFLHSPESKPFPAERIFAESQKASALFWAEYIHRAANPARDMLSSVPSTWPTPARRLINTDREDIVFTELHFRIKDEPKLRKRLAALRTFEYDKADDSWTWLKAKSRLDPEEPRTVLGTFRIKDGRVV